MLYEKEYEFRYGDLDKDGNIKIASILDVLQDVAVCHSAEVGNDMEFLYSKSLAWLLEGWRIKIDQLVSSKPITVKTGIMEMRHFTSYRKYEVWQDGVCKIKATASWFLVNTALMRPTLIPSEISSAFSCVNEEDNGLPFLKLRPMLEPEFVSENPVFKRDLDTNNHMNNVKSAEIALELLPDNFEIDEIRITYRKAIQPKDTVKQCGCKADNGYYAELRNGIDETCVLVNVIAK